ncbi:ankyrin repeat domain-containing protein SOWAHB [Ochotona princeps]|uniref:ankyrin repeat domain-containing protein SOWAHB n=1 Tax=Ochotona princeps TaxID=9978 RepID=UPI002714D87A|nr:ankyrin repeat domain-containing protein SOWAHB [Ochotona princeps]
MARELSQEALLDFLCQAGGRVTNASLLSHFKSFLRDPDAPPSEHQRRRELFKGFVNSVAAVRVDPDGTKCVVLKRRYRDLLGEEGLQRPREPPAAATPVGEAAPRGPPQPKRQQRRRREKEPEAEPAGAAVPAADARCNGLPASGTRQQEPGKSGGGGGRRCSPGSGAAAQVAVRCAAAETQGRCCWECLQNGLGALPGEQLPQPGVLPDPGTATPGPLRTSPVPEQRRTPPAAPSSPAAPVGAAGRGASPPVLQQGPDAIEEPPEPLSAGSPHLSTLELQRRRTREWVAKHPQRLEERAPGPVRAWSVLPDDFLQPSLELSPSPSAKDPSLSSPGHVTVIPDEASESRLGDLPPLNVFRSIRCQLSLQDLHDFVDQDSHGSEESSSAPKDSPGVSEEGVPMAPGTPAWGQPKTPAQHLTESFKVTGSPGHSPQGLCEREAGHSSQQVPATAPANGLAEQPKLRRSLRRSSRAGRATLSSSDEEYPGEERPLKSRRPPRPRKPSRTGPASSPRVDAALTFRLTELRPAVVEKGRAHSVERPASWVPHRTEHKPPSLVPLEAREHQWIVMLACGSWNNVLALFQEDPQLALHKDFLTGYTALHWIAKHGTLWALQKLLLEAHKVGIALDVNVRSSCGYTPLHLAAIHGHHGVIKMLVQRLACRVNVRDCSGKKPWQYLTSNTSGEIWQLLGAPRGKPIFPVSPLVHSSSPSRKTKSRDVARNVTRKTSLAALLKSQHSKWKLANHHEKFPAAREREECSD